MKITADNLRSAVLLIFLLLPILGVFFPFESYLSAPTAANPLGTPVPDSGMTLIILTIIAATIVGLYTLAPGPMTAALSRNWPLLLFVAWAFVTAAWSEVPGRSFNRTGRMLIAILVALYLAETLQPSRIVRLLCVALLIGMTASIAVTVAVPSLSRTIDFRGAWRGAFGHKNSTGTAAALALVFAAYGFYSGALWRSVMVVLGLGALVTLLMSNSVTALIAAILATGIGFGCLLMVSAKPEERFAVIIAAAFGVGLLIFAVVSLSDSGLEFAGRDATLTGRTDVWSFTQSMIDRRPIWGYGHGAWGTPSFAEGVLVVLRWPAPHAHSTYLDLHLQLGLPGLMLGVLIWMLLVWRVLIGILVCRDPEFVLWVAVAVLMAVRAMSETIMVDPAAGEIFWITVAYARLGKLVTATRPRSGLVVVRSA
ncbi:O-antigen ligase family protein [Methylorubrum aminovorans]